MINQCKTPTPEGDIFQPEEREEITKVIFSGNVLRLIKVWSKKQLYSGIWLRKR